MAVTYLHDFLGEHLFGFVDYSKRIGNVFVGERTRVSGPLHKLSKFVSYCPEGKLVASMEENTPSSMWCWVLVRFLVLLYGFRVPM
jgi:hypothetical protein